MTDADNILSTFKEGDLIQFDEIETQKTITGFVIDTIHSGRLIITRDYRKVYLPETVDNLILLETKRKRFVKRMARLILTTPVAITLFVIIILLEICECISDNDEWIRNRFSNYIDWLGK